MILTYGAFILLGLIWGSNFIYMKWATALISPEQIVLLRVFFGFLPLAFAAWRKGAIDRSQLRHLPHFLAMASVATALYYFAIVKGTALLPSGIAGVLGGSIALFTAISSLVFLRTEKLNRLMALGVALGFAGIVMIARPWEGASNRIDPMGVFWMLSGAVILGLSYVYVRRFLSPLNLPPLALVTWQMGLALFILLLVTNLTGIGRITQNTHAAIGLVIGLGVLGTGTAFLLYYQLLEKLGAVAASGATYITPVVALLIGWINGEDVGILELAAVILILGSIAMLQLGRQRSVQETCSSPKI
ncbi:DMT family transporter [Phyllobacterium myrsinacearum]|uniref:Drug/metabolite transporter (DMT)-like permease n=1 Tax=Phyllobacterium myrsinacearum TaxID=28101 RepID=A0A839ENN5_9HYPH|nr:DMT family transporter [Phyllobacterium myrsinacearum]MBA8879104.1 drug/metabolite transporter (DMT)-like permease [Phyllobacterium myrsinacearum]